MLRRPQKNCGALCHTEIFYRVGEWHPPPPALQGNLAPLMSRPWYYPTRVRECRPALRKPLRRSVEMLEDRGGFVPENCHDKASLYTQKFIYRSTTCTLGRTSQSRQTQTCHLCANVASSSEQGRVPKACVVKPVAIQLATSHREI